MATETHNGVELRNTVDNTDAQAGLKRLEQDTAATARRITENDAREARRRSEASGASLKQRASVGLSAGTALADMAGTALSAAGHSDAGRALSSAADGARQLGTMLAPLGPQAALVGAAFGGVAAAVRSLATSSEEAKRRMDELSQSLRDEGARRAIRENRLETPEQWAEYQHEARARMGDLRVKLERGATVSEDEVMEAARWDPALARELMDRVRKQNKGNTPDALKPLRDLYFYGADHYREPMERTREEQIKYGAAHGWRGSRTLARQYQRQSAEVAAIEALGPEIIEAARRGTGFDEARDALWAQLHAPKGGALADAGDAEGLPAAAARGLEPARADALSAAGIGYTGSPMRRTEELLTEIRDDARRAARRPDAGVIA